MKPIIFLFIVIASFLSPFDLSPQSIEKWNWINPTPHANAMYGMAKITPNTIVAVGDYGIIIKSTDAGNTWVHQNSKTFNQLNAVSFSNELMGCAVGDSGTILTTSDGGISWIYFRYDQYSQFSGVSYVDQNSCVVVGNPATILISTNSGQNWIKKTTTSIRGYRGVSFFDRAFGIVVGYGGEILRTTDGGNSWLEQIYRHQGDAYDLHAVACVDSKIAYAVGGSGVITKSTDGGISWFPLLGIGGENLYAVSFSNPNIGYVLGDNGRVLSTSVGGLGWIDRSTNDKSYFRSLVTLDTKTLLISGFKATQNFTSSLYKSQNSGQTWTDLIVGVKEGLQELIFTDEFNGFAVGQKGIFLRSFDGGNNWSRVSIGTTKNLYGVGFFDSLTGVVVGDSGLVMITSDGGKSWQNKTDDIQSIVETRSKLRPFFTAACYSTSKILIAGYNGMILHSTDSGNSWIVLQQYVPYSLKRIFISDDQNISIVGDNGTILRTKNSGASWELQQTGIRTDFHGIYCLDKYHGYVTGSGAVLYTDDGGDIWINKLGPIQAALMNVYFIDSQIGFVCGHTPNTNDPSKGGVIFSTQDGGDSWIQQKVITQNLFSDLWVLKNGEIIVVGANGCILKFFTKELTSYNNDLSKSLTSQSLNIYPNPYGKETTISFSLTETEKATIRVVDCLGRVVKTWLIDSRLRSSVLWTGVDEKGQKVPPGIYFVKVHSSHSSLAGKIILLK